jgi:hypothetical protein
MVHCSQSSVFNFYQGHLVELFGRKLLPDCLQGALLDTCNQNAHVLGAAAQLLFGVASMFL